MSKEVNYDMAVVGFPAKETSFLGLLFRGGIWEGMNTLVEYHSISKATFYLRATSVLESD